MLRSLFLVAALSLSGFGCGSDDDPAPPDAAVSNTDGGGGSLAFMDTCDPTDDQCTDGLTCFMFNSKGPHCTHDCTLDTECEAPSPGCNNMGVCKAP